MKLTNSSVDISVSKQYHKFIVGKRGVNIKKIRDETNAQIDVPPEGTDSDVINIYGKKEDVLLAKEKIMAIQEELDHLVAKEVVIPAELHGSVIGKNGRLINSINEDCKKVTIRFPDLGSDCDKVCVEGPIVEVDKAEMLLISCTAQVKADPKYYKYLIGRQGANIKKVSDKTGAAISFPRGDENKDIINIFGRKEEVEAAKKELENLISELENPSIIHIDPKHHPHFFARKAKVLKQITDEFDGICVSFPEVGSDSDEVSLRGVKDRVEGAEAKFLEIVQDLDSRVSIRCEIENKYHRTVLGAKGKNVQNIEKDFDVSIKFPDQTQDSESDEDESLFNLFFTDDESDAHSNNVPVSPPFLRGASDGDYFSDSGSNKQDLIIIKGQKENCEIARQALLDLVPITEEITAPHDLHRFLIGPYAENVVSMMDMYDVKITIPRYDAYSDTITIQGLPFNIEKAKGALQEKIKQLQLERQKKNRASITEKIEVPCDFHRAIIGICGRNIRDMMDTYDVDIIFPLRNHCSELVTIKGSPANVQKTKVALIEKIQELKLKEQDMLLRNFNLSFKVDPLRCQFICNTERAVISEIMDEYDVTIDFKDHIGKITITGYEAKALAAKEEILKVFQEQEDVYKEEIKIDTNLHSYIIGSRKKNLLKIKDQYKVDIQFSKFFDPDPERVVILGTEAAVLDAKRYLLTLKEEYERAHHTEEIEVPFNLHRSLIGPKGKDVRCLMEMYDVHISFPPLSECSDMVTIKGPPPNVESTKAAIMHRIEQLRLEEQEKSLRSFQLSFEIDPQYHPKIIGTKGAVISKLSKKYDVNIKCPGSKEANNRIITVTGHEKNAEAAKEAILKLVEEEKIKSFQLSFEVEPLCYQKIRYTKGAVISNFRQKYKVKIDFSKQKGASDSMITITGYEKDAKAAKKAILKLLEEQVQDI